MKPLTVREWLERERLSGLPHADFAAEALRRLDIADGGDELIEEINDVLDGPGDLVGACKELVAFYDAVLEVLTDAGVVDDDVAAADVGSLLSLFLPC